MKITEKTTIGEIIPEGYILDGKNPLTDLDIDNSGLVTFRIKKKEVKDFTWYIEKYFGVEFHKSAANVVKVRACRDFCNYSHISAGFYDKATFESKIGLLKFICDDLELNAFYYIKYLGNGWNTEKFIKLKSICPPEFLNLIFK